MYTFGSIFHLVDITSPNQPSLEDAYAMEIANVLNKKLIASGINANVVQSGRNLFTFTAGIATVEFCISVQWWVWSMRHNLALTAAIKHKLLDNKLSRHVQYDYQIDRTAFDPTNDEPIDYVDNIVNFIIKRLRLMIKKHNKNIDLYAKLTPIPQLT